MLVAGQDRDPNLRIAIINRDGDITVSDGSQALVVTASSITAHHQVR